MKTAKMTGWLGNKAMLPMQSPKRTETCQRNKQEFYGSDEWTGLLLLLSFAFFCVEEFWDLLLSKFVCCSLKA